MDHHVATLKKEFFALDIGEPWVLKEANNETHDNQCRGYKSDINQTYIEDGNNNTNRALHSISKGKVQAVVNNSQIVW